MHRPPEPEAIRLQHLERLDSRALTWIAITLIAAGSAARIGVYFVAPLWFDETFTLVIATQHSFSGFGEWVLNELGGPVYYALVFCWDKVFGSSTFSIRLPSLLASIATLAYASRSKVGAPPMGLIWAALLALWPAGMLQAGSARSYALLILVMTIQTVAFVRLVDRTDLRRAAVWFGWSSMAILLHYHATLICLIQGILLLVFRTRPALRCWPAALILIPVLTWAGLQASFVLAYATPGANWYALVKPLAFPFVLIGALGWGWMSIIVILEPLAAGAAWLVRRQPFPADRLGLALVIASALASLIILIAVGMVVPSFNWRYAIPFMPAVFLGIAVWLVTLPRRYSLVPPALVLAAMSITPLGAMWRSVVHPIGIAEQFNIEAASDWILSNGGADRLVFLWDNPTAKVSSTRHLSQFGAYFLRRGGARPEVIIPRGADSTTDPNAFLPRMAGNAPRSAIIWINDVGVPGTIARHIPPKIAEQHRDWQCKKFGRGQLRIDACVKRPK